MIEPAIIQIETLRGCNAHCKFCCRSYESGCMSDALLDNLLEQASRFQKLPKIVPHMANEPFLDTRMPELLCRLSQHLVEVYSNGTVFTPQLLERLPKAGWTRLCLNVCTLDAAAYEANYGLALSKLVVSVKNLLAWLPKQMTLEVINVDGNVTVEQTEAVFGQPIPVVLTKRLNWRGTLYENEIPKTVCSRPNSTICVNYDGRVALCCFDESAEYCLGDATKQSLLEIYNNKLFQAYRETKHGFAPCDRCNHP